MTGRVQDKATTIAHPSLQNQGPVAEVVSVPRNEASLVVSHSIVWVREREDVLHGCASSLVVCPSRRAVDGVASRVEVVVSDAFATWPHEGVLRAEMGDNCLCVLVRESYVVSVIGCEAVGGVRDYVSDRG
jgi:hypothetical protein